MIKHHRNLERRRLLGATIIKVWCERKKRMARAHDRTPSHPGLRRRCTFATRRTRCVSADYPLNLQPSPFRRSLPTPPKPSRTTSQRPVHDTTSLISSAVNIIPDDRPISGRPIPFSLFDQNFLCPLLPADSGTTSGAGLEMPAGVTILRRSATRSISTSGRGNGTLSSATTLG